MLPAPSAPTLFSLYAPSYWAGPRPRGAACGAAFSGLTILLCRTVWLFSPERPSTRSAIGRGSEAAASLAKKVRFCCGSTYVLSCVPKALAIWSAVPCASITWPLSLTPVTVRPWLRRKAVTFATSAWVGA